MELLLFAARRSDNMIQNLLDLIFECSIADDFKCYSLGLRGAWRTK